MAAQQILFSETVAGMKKALKRTAYESDSDNEIEHYSNRGNKLKKRALFAHQGQLIPPSGPEVYKRDVEYLGQRRSVISRNPPILDDEGYEVDSDEDEDRVQEAISSAAELNPYAGIRLEQVLAPLTASTDLPTHPTLSKAYTSKTLTDLANQSCQVMRKENQSLWRVKQFFTQLCGDITWAPCEMMIGPNDIELFSDALPTRNRTRDGAAMQDGDAETTTPNNSTGNIQLGNTSGSGDGNGGTSGADPPNGVPAITTRSEGADEDVHMADGTTNGTEPLGGSTEGGREAAQISAENSGSRDDETADEAAAEQQLSSEAQANGERGVAASGDARGGPNDGLANGEMPPPPSEQIQEPETIPEDRNTVRPAASGQEGDVLATERNDAISVGSAASDERFIHPLFLAPPKARSDRAGLAKPEADNMMGLMAMYVQKQEEICRGVRKLHEGLLKADRLRAEVMRWSKAEAHCGPNRDMSDGEDWYDKEEWGLVDDLKKGHDEEEEDTGTATKKTRNRR